MQSLMTVWSALDARKRMFVILSTLAVFASVLLLAKGSNSRDMALLFGGLEAAAAGDVIKALDQSAAVYEIRGNAIYVESNSRDALRMSLAGEGLPSSGSQGYELLDSLSGFGTTSQMFDAAYWRAKEGELARTILSSPLIRAARVHISTPSSRAFQREQTPSAAVTITTNGGNLPSRNIKALQYLVASAVQGLTPEAVAIIDGNGGLISESDSQNLSSHGDEQAEELRKRAERLLAARVGAGNAVVEVSVETVSETELITERTFDPAARVAISTDITESTAKSQDSGGGNVTVASNLPDGAAGGDTGSASNENTESRALTNYEVNETQRQLTRAPGDVRRLTVAVLVNDVVTVDAAGVSTTTPRSAEELASLEALVGSAIGLNTDRGDVITLRSMSFEPIGDAGTDGVVSAASNLNIMRLVQIAVLAVVSIILGLFVVRPILAPNGPTALPPPVQPDWIENNRLPAAIGVDAQGAKAAGSVGLPPPQAGSQQILNGEDDDPVSRLRQMISERESETIQILQDWMEQPEEAEKA